MQKDFDFGEIKDSGTREETITGATREIRKGKGRYDLLSPIALCRLARHFENGAENHDERNWERGMPLSWFMNSAIRHLFGHLAGKRDEDHLAAAEWNIHCLIHTEEKIARGELPAELDDMPCPPLPELMPVETPKCRECGGEHTKMTSSEHAHQCQACGFRFKTYGYGEDPAA